MVTVTVKRHFWDISAKVRRKEGDTFVATPERFAEIEQRLPGYITYTEEPEGSSLSSLGMSELRAIAAERGIEVPKRTSKQQLIELIGE